MDVLVVGGGGREHALVWALRRSPQIRRMYCSPGNAGIAGLATCWDIAPGNLEGLAAAAAEHQVDLVAVGPEAPLVAGIADLLEERGIPCFGPSRRAAVIEASKAFAKAFMARHGIPTAPFAVFDQPEAAVGFLADPPWGYPLVVKADGLAAGKGAVVCRSRREAEAAVNAAMVEGAFGRAGERVVIEEFLEGEEATFMALCDGERALPLLPSQDHKAIYDGDRGPNTGGMGAYAPADAVIDAELSRRIEREIVAPAVRGLAEEDRPFRGVLYAGLMLTESGPKVLEFNCRFGDPEAQVVIPLLEEDFAERLAAIANAEGVGPALRWSGRSCACVVVAAPGYPGRARHGLPIDGLEELEGRPDVLVFHAGTAWEEGRLVTAGGRVLGIAALGDDLDAALDRAYAAIGHVHFEGMHFRRDIGRRARRTA